MSLGIQHGDAKVLFEACDLDASGYIDRHELAAVVDCDPEDLREIFETLDTDEDGRISIEEFTENFNRFKNLASQIEKDKEDDEDADVDTVNSNDSAFSGSEKSRPKKLIFDRGKVNLKAKIVGG